MIRPMGEERDAYPNEPPPREVTGGPQGTLLRPKREDGRIGSSQDEKSPTDETSS